MADVDVDDDDDIRNYNFVAFKTKWNLLHHMFALSSSMGNTRIKLIFSWILLIFQFLRVYTQLTYVFSYCLTDYGNYTENSAYHQNLNLLLSNLSSSASTVNFKNVSIGESTDKVYGLFQCRQDLSLDVCNNCIKSATQSIVQKCTLFNEAITWYYECMVRYANRDIFQLGEVTPSSDQWVQSNVTSQFSQALSDTMDDFINEASHFATRENNLSGAQKLYCLAQCTSNVDAVECRSCLRAAYAEITSRCGRGCTRGLTFLPSCQLRYDITLFYNDTRLVSFANPPSNTPQGSGKESKAPIIGGVVGAVSIGLLLLLIVLWLFRRKSEKEAKGLHEKNLGDVEYVQYDFATLRDATQNFSIDNRLGEGGFGVVYKGTLNNGEEIAIKRLSHNSGQGATEFMTEARILAKLQHRNLVKLLGFCSEGNEKLLVYEFMPNTSLDMFIFDQTKRPLLEWETWNKIILGIAKGLQYLHEDSRLRIIHRDLKPSNILLDKKMNAKIADFGIAKLLGGEQRGGTTNIIVGTKGYMAPEYTQRGEYSDKTDVYSFGIIVLEIMSGQKNSHFYHEARQEGLPTYAWSLWKEGKSLELTVPDFDKKKYSSEFMRCIQIAMLCIQGNAVNRPTMTNVVLMLTGSITLPLPLSPAVPQEQVSIPVPYHETDHPMTKSHS